MIFGLRNRRIGQYKQSLLLNMEYHRIDCYLNEFGEKEEHLSGRRILERKTYVMSTICNGLRKEKYYAAHTVLL